MPPVEVEIVPRLLAIEVIRRMGGKRPVLRLARPLRGSDPD
jgi:hypothetical protein